MSHYSYHATLCQQQHPITFCPPAAICGCNVARSHTQCVLIIFHGHKIVIQLLSGHRDHWEHGAQQEWRQPYQLRCHKLMQGTNSVCLYIKQHEKFLFFVVLRLMFHISEALAHLRVIGLSILLLVGLFLCFLHSEWHFNFQGVPQHFSHMWLPS